MAYSRREFGALTAGAFMIGLGAPGLETRGIRDQASRIAGVRIGTQSYSFRDRSLDSAIAAMKDVGLSYCELWSGHVETREAIVAPEGVNRRDATRTWRLEKAVAVAKDIKRRFDEANVKLTSYDVPFRADFTDDEITRMFEMGRAFDVEVITSSTQVSIAPRLEPFAAKAGMRVGFHNHSRVSPDEVATPDDLMTVMKAGPHMSVTLDVGHFTAANFDALAFLDEHHDRIVSMHLKDRKRDQGATVPFGEGDARIADVVLRLRDRRWDIPAHIEFEYRGDTVAEMQKLLGFCRQTLEKR